MNYPQRKLRKQFHQKDYSSEERIVFQTNDIRTFGYPQVKIRSCISHHMQKIKSKWIKDVKAKNCRK